MKRFLTLFFLILILTPHSEAQKKTLKTLDAYFQKSMEEWSIPGIAVAIVKDGDIIFEKGYGVRNVDSGEPVDENTLFAVASNTKAFTAASVAMLVDEGKMDWDDKVQDYLPWFQLYDPYVSANMTVRDLLCHRSGLATFSGDLIWYGSKHNREEVVRRARHLEPTMDFRAGYGYQNIMFITAGLVIEEVSGQSWDQFIRERFLAPLDMNRTTTTTRTLGKTSNVSAPHNLKGEKNHTIDWVNWDNIAPAGSIISSVHDMSQWLKLQLGDGMLDSVEFWSAAQTNQMRTIHTPKMLSGWSKENFPTKTFAGYGLGWDIYNYHNHTIINHGGGYDGMISQTVFVPEADLAFVVLTNNINWLPSALTHKILDAFLGNPKKDNKDWSTYYHGFKIQGDKADKEEREKLEAERNKETTPSLNLEAYAGIYRSQVYGDVELKVIGDQLAFQFEPTPLFRGTLRHWQHDSFQLNWGSQMMLPSGWVQFILTPQGEVEEMRIDVPNPDFDFSELKLFRVKKPKE